MPKGKKRRKNGSRSSTLLVTLIVIVVISILIIYYVYTHFPTSPISSKPLNQQYIPLYVDSLTYKIIDVDSVSSIVSETVDSSQRELINLIAFGSLTCPHCKNLHDFFERYFKDRYIFLWVENTDTAILFRRLAQIEQNNGVPLNYAYAVPQTIVVKHGKPVAIVIGSTLDVSFWQNLLS